jgi:hypothetical protein
VTLGYAASLAWAVLPYLNRFCAYRLVLRVKFLIKAQVFEARWNARGLGSPLPSRQLLGTGTIINVLALSHRRINRSRTAA